MSVAGWKEQLYSDDLVWDALANGEMDGIGFSMSGIQSIDDVPDEKEQFLSITKRIKPRTISELAIVLTLVDRYLFREEDAEQILLAYEKKEQTGPFEELEETYGYPIFKDQVVAVITNNFRLDADQAYQFADDMAKKRPAARKKLFSSRKLDKQKKEYLWSAGAMAYGRRWMMHDATLIYEMCWHIYNSAPEVREYYKKNPFEMW